MPSISTNFLNIRRLLLLGVTSMAAFAQTITPALPTAAAGQAITLTASASTTWCSVSGSIGTLTVGGTTAPTCPSVSATSVTASYTAPTTGMVSRNTIGGCMVMPMDSVFNTRIDSLPLDARSSTWTANINTLTNAGLNFVPSWGFNVIDNTVATTTPVFNYTGEAGAQFQIIPPPNRKRENGANGAFSSLADHHVVSVNKQTCHFYETYQDGVAAPVGKDATSGFQYLWSRYAMPTAAATDAANLPIQALTIHANEIRAGLIKHALRVTYCNGCMASAHQWPAGSSTATGLIANVPPMGARMRLKASISTTGVMGSSFGAYGSGYTTLPTVTITGCTVAPTAHATLYSGGVGSIIIDTYGSGCVNPVAVFTGGGGSGAIQNLYVPNAAEQAILVALQQYGALTADIGGNNQITYGSDLSRDKTASDAPYRIQTLAQDSRSFAGQGLNIQDFEFVDITGMAVNAANSYEVAPAKAEAGTFAVIQAGATQFPIALEPVTVGFQDEDGAIQASGPAYTFSAIVNGASINPAVTWSLANCSLGGTLCGAINSVTGAYVPPASVPVSVTVTVKVVATSAQDAAISAPFLLNILPAGANIYIDSGSYNWTADTAGNKWSPDIAMESSSGMLRDAGVAFPVALVDQAMWQTNLRTYTDDIMYGPFIVPNGNYLVNLSFGIGGCAGSWLWKFATNWRGPMDLETQGVTQLHNYDFGFPVGYICKATNRVSIPATVTNNVLKFALRGTGTTALQYGSTLNGVTITPDATAAHWAIDIGKPQARVNLSGVVNCTVEDFYTGAVAAKTWSIVSGPGSIDSALGVYTAPASLALTAPVTVQVTDGTYTAQTTFIVNGTSNSAAIAF